MVKNTAPVVAQERPLTQTQLKNLQALVEGDFADLEQQIRTEVENQTSRRIDQITAKYADQADLDAARQRLVEAGRQAEDSLRALVRQIIADSGGSLEVEHNPRGYRRELLSVEIDPELLIQKGRDKEIEAAQKAAHRLLTRALQVLSREQRQVQRQVLLQGITASSALQLIQDLPEREDILNLVRVELAASEEDSADIRALLPGGDEG